MAENDILLRNGEEKHKRRGNGHTLIQSPLFRFGYVVHSTFLSFERPQPPLASQAEDSGLVIRKLRRRFQRLIDLVEVVTV